MNVTTLLQIPDLKNYLNKFFDRVNLRKLSKTFPDILTDFDSLWQWKELGPVVSGNTYPKLNDYLNIMVSQTLKAYLNYYAQGEVINQAWYTQLKSKHSFVAYLSQVLSTALSRVIKPKDPFNSCLVVLAATLALNNQSDKFSQLFKTTWDLDSDFDEIVFRIQQSMHALAPLEKMYLDWFDHKLPLWTAYFQKLAGDSQVCYLNAHLNLGKIDDYCDSVVNLDLIKFIYSDQIQLPSEWFYDLLISYCLWNFNNGQTNIEYLSLFNLKHSLAYHLEISQLDAWLKQYFSFSFHDLVKKVMTIINANKN